MLAEGQAITEWAEVFKAAGGKLMSFGRGGAVARPRPGNPRVAPGTAGESSPRTVFDQIAAKIIRGLVTPAYHDRVDPLIAYLADYARAMAAAEKRIAELAKS